MKYALHVDARWLTLARRKKRNKILLFQGMRFLSILIKLVKIRGVLPHKWRMLSIHAIVRDSSDKVLGGLIAYLLFSHYYFMDCTVRAPVFGRYQFFGTSEHYGKAHGSLLSG